jgi:thioredoxin reductase
MENNLLDVVIVGGGAAGLSGALALARSRRNVVVVDDGHPRNLPADAVHNYLTRDGLPPTELIRLGREEVISYGGAFETGHVTSARSEDGAFVLGLAGGKELRARRILIASGLTDELPDLPGLTERWGRDVLHCPYCHGWEVRDKLVGVLATGPLALHQVFLFRQLTPTIILFLHNQPQPTADILERLHSRGIQVVENAVEGLIIKDDKLAGVRLGDGREIPLEALAVQTRLNANVAFAADLGLKPVPHPMGVGNSLKVTGFGRTDVPGVWVAGNAGDLMGQVITSAANGLMAAADINMDLVTADTDDAVANLRATLPTAPTS